MKKVAFLCVFVSVLAFGGEKEANEFMADFKAVFGDEKCEKTLRRHALNCFPVEKEKVEKCEKWRKERTECVEKNKKKKKGI